MRIEFTVRGPRSSCDVAVTASASTPLGDVPARLARLVGVDPVTPARLDGVELRAEQTLGECGLRTGAVLDFGAFRPPRRALRLLSAQVIAGTTAAPPVPLRREGLTIGRDPASDVVVADDRASRRHARMRPQPAGVAVTDLGSTNGTLVDGDCAPVAPAAGVVAEPGAVVRVGDTLVSLRGVEAQPPAAVTVADGTVHLHRAPRTSRLREPATLADDGASSTAAPPGRVQWLAAALPALAGGLLAWVMSSPLFLLFALLSPAMMVSGALGDRLSWRRARRRHRRAESRRRAELATAVADELAAETLALRRTFPDSAVVLDIALGPGRRLWERGRGDDDLLCVRVGSHDAASRTTVGTGADAKPAGTLPAVPYVVDLRDGPVGIVGSDADVAGLLRWLVGQLVVLHSPADVRLVPVLRSGSADRYDVGAWCRWLPHTTSSTGDGVAAVVASLSSAVSGAAPRASLGSPGPWRGPWTVVLAGQVNGADGADAAALSALLEDGRRAGVTAIWAARTSAQLPAACHTVLRADADSHCRLTVTRSAARDRPTSDGLTVIAERVPAAWSERVARALAPMRDAYAAPALPHGCDLSDLVAPLAREHGTDPSAVVRQWRASDGGARTAIGVSRDGPVLLDLVAAGPHALVAGTTGSGKSELLRSLVVGLAAHHPPEQLTFVLVDYKGGATFGDAGRLPHTTGVMTDLDAAGTERALRSLRAELRRREALFAAAGVVDLDAYRRSPSATASAPPRLVIVIDEFAELADELPQFVDGLVGVARRGRSLGVHLVLATQRPGTAVTNEIRANTALRIALRVTGAAESADVIDSPDAAMLDPTRPGRACARIGGQLVELQTARVAASGRDEQTGTLVEVLDHALRPVTSPSRADADQGMSRVVDLIAAAAVEIRSGPTAAPWLPTLPSLLPLRDLRASGDHAPAIGLLDLPDEQAQPPLVAEGDTLVIGRAQSGRTTALLVTALAHAARLLPGRLRIHVVEMSGELARRLAPLPHRGTRIDRDSIELVPRLLSRLATASRSDATSVVLVDDWDLITALVGDQISATWSESLTALSRATAGRVTVAVSGGRSLLTPRFASTFATRLVLALDDDADHGLAGVPSHAVASRPDGPGGGLLAGSGTAFRLAYPGDEPSAVETYVAEISRQWPHATAAGSGVVVLRALPSSVDLDSVRALAGRAGPLIGVAGDDATPCGLDLVARRGRLLVAGPARSGRTTALRTMAAEACRAGYGVVVAAPPRSPLRAFAQTNGAVVITVPPRHAPSHPTLLLVDDVDAVDENVCDALTAWVLDATAPPGVVVAGRSDELATSYNPLVAAARRERCGLLLRPTPLDGDLLGVRIAPPVTAQPPGRGVLVGDPAWGAPFDEPDPVPVQVATP